MTLFSNKPKTYEVKDLFFTSWNQLSGQVHAEVYALQQELCILPGGTENPKYGFLLIGILRRLRKNLGLVNKVSVEQAVDIYNDMKFLKEPWHYFPVVHNKALPLIAPDEYMARHTFDHFIYADNEFTSYIALKDPKYLRRLLVTLYRLPGEELFDKEGVEIREARINGRVKDWQLTLVFFSYAQVRQFITKRCKTLLPASPPAKADEEPMKIVPTGSMWMKLKHRLAETTAFSGYDNAGRANIYSALDYLEDLSQMKSQKNGKA